MSQIKIEPERYQFTPKIQEPKAGAYNKKLDSKTDIHHFLRKTV